MMMGDCRQACLPKSRFTTSTVWLGLLMRTLWLSRNPQPAYWSLSLSRLFFFKAVKIWCRKYVWGGWMCPVLLQTNILKMCRNSVDIWPFSFGIKLLILPVCFFKYFSSSFFKKTGYFDILICFNSQICERAKGINTGLGVLSMRTY